MFMVYDGPRPDPPTISIESTTHYNFGWLIVRVDKGNPELEAVQTVGLICPYSFGSMDLHDGAPPVSCMTNPGHANIHKGPFKKIKSKPHKQELSQGKNQF